VRARWITATVAVAAVAAGGAAATQASGAPARPAAATLHLSASTNKLAFNVKSLSAKHGKVTLVMANPSSLQHGVAIQGHAVGKVVGKGRTSTITVTLKKGTYTFYCPVPGHRAAGMKGTLTVT
jgi:plastocyanin